jgi:MFS family permease
MVIIYLIGNKVNGKTLIIIGCLLTGISFLILNLLDSILILYLSILIMSLGEIFAMPYMVIYTTERASPKTQGAYMGMYSLTYSTAFVIAPLLGTRLIAIYDFEFLWWFISRMALLASLGFYLIIRKTIASHILDKVVIS